MVLDNLKKIRNHMDLDAWRMSMDLVEEIYNFTKKFPQDELYGLTGQMRRCAISIPSNIAEGAARNSNKDFSKYLFIALGSAAEIETQILIAERLGYVENVKDILSQVRVIKKLINGLISFLKKRIDD
jgi:four helix bundle protein